MQRIFTEFKNFVFKNLMTLVILSVVLFAMVTILLWATLLVIWTEIDWQTSKPYSIILISGLIILVVFSIASVVFFLQKMKLEKLKALSIETELAQNLLVVNSFRQALIDYESALDGKTK